MDIETQLMNELAENGTDRARELFLQWQEERIKAKEKLIEKLKAVNNNCDLANVSQSFCSCEKPKHNYPEMVWCDNCGLEIKD